MASITSIISLFILLAAYCYSVPVDKRPVSLLTDNEFTTGKTIIDHEHNVNMQLIPDEDSTGVPNIHKERTIGEHDSDESTTPHHFETHEDESHSLRVFDDFSTPVMFISEHSVKDDKRSFDDFSTPVILTSEHSVVDDKRSFDDVLFTTLESSTEFERRAIFPEDVTPEVELTTLSKRKFEDEFETTTDFVSTPFVEHEDHASNPSSSIDSFGKITGLLHDDKSEEKLSTPKYEDDHSKEESTHRLYKTVAIIPGKVTETKIYSNSPIKTNVVVDDYQDKPKQLSQGEKQPVVEKEKSY